MFTSVQTDRLLLRPFRTQDLDALLARRNDPRVAIYQDWELPYTREQAEALSASVGAMSGPEDGVWWMLTVADFADSVVLGDLVVHMTNQMRTAEIGYSFGREHWGSGFAVEAVDALLGYLFSEFALTRIEAMLHPDNLASELVLERTGFLFEGHKKLSYWLGDDNSDDLIYAMTRPDWEAWVNRDRSPPGDVRLVELNPENNHAAWRLKTHRTQERFVSPMPESFADALFPEPFDGVAIEPRMFGVEADGAMVGFVMIAVAIEHDAEPYLWRLLIDRVHQRRGIGRRALDLVIEQCKRNGDSALLTSWSEGRGSPEPFYLRYGFVPTGRIVDEEIEARLEFA